MHELRLFAINSIIGLIEIMKMLNCLKNTCLGAFNNMTLHLKLIQGKYICQTNQRIGWITPFEVATEIDNLKPKKAPGIDEISPAVG